jgi:hypothetical protein
MFDEISPEVDPVALASSEELLATHSDVGAFGSFSQEPLQGVALQLLLGGERC